MNNYNSMLHLEIARQKFELSVVFYLGLVKNKYVNGTV